MIHTNCRRLTLLPMATLAVGCGGIAPPKSPPAPESGVAVDSTPAVTPSVPATPAPPAPTYTERYRPQYHFTPAVNWMNDPNGLVYYDGEYHLFYQYNPFGNRWGHMSWGHAVSPDLVDWEHLPVTIPEEDGVMAWSGSAVVDWKNTSGFGQGGEPPLVAIYTGRREGNQSQFLAYSTDRGRTWTRYAGNPALDIGSPEFRDPKVFWYEPDQKWVMAVALPTEHKISFYSSPDLKQWTHLSDFGPMAATGGIWEVPDLFQLPVYGDPNNKRWVLQVDLNPGGPVGGSGGQYFIGDFDGTRFIPAPRPSPETPRWVDYGSDFYAPITFSDIPAEQGRRVWIGWINNWLYGQNIPTSPWRSTQSITRKLSLRTIDGELRLAQEPVEELKKLRGEPRRLAAQPIPEGTMPLADRGIAGKALEIIAEFEPGTAEEVGLKVRTGEAEETIIGIDREKEVVFVDRTRSGQTDFHPEFAARHEGPVRLEDGRVRLHVFVDWSSVEVFAEDGATVITDQIFPAPESEGVELYARGGTARLVSLDAWPLESIWSEAAGQTRTDRR